MSGSYIEEIIKKEIAAATTLDEWTSVFINKHLVEPVKELYVNSFDESQTFEFWTVLIEDADGYRIAFDEEGHDFVLGMYNSEGQLEYIGHQGSFIEALKGM